MIQLTAVPKDTSQPPRPPLYVRGCDIKMITHDGTGTWIGISDKMAAYVQETVRQVMRLMRTEQADNSHEIVCVGCLSPEADGLVHDHDQEDS